MEWITAAVADKGPWAVLLTALSGIVLAVWKGALVPGPTVDRIVKAYEDMVAAKADEAATWRAAHAVEVEAGRVLREQNGKLLEHSSVSAHAWDSIRAEVERRSDEAA